MNTLKCIGAVGVLAGSCAMGFACAATVNAEITSLRRLVSALNYMSCELQYRLTPLPELCRKTAGECKGSLRHLFNNLSQEIENQISPDVKSCMRSALSKTKKIPSLTEKSLKMLGASLGRFDLAGQINGLELVRNHCQNILKELALEKGSRLRTYKTLGICAGAAIVIILV